MGVAKLVYLEGVATPAYLLMALSVLSMKGVSLSVISLPWLIPPCTVPPSVRPRATPGMLRRRGVAC
jgi:hypothetical protein